MDNEIEICEQCGGDMKRVGLFNCDDGHPVPNLAQRIARAIENDLNDRRGLHLSSLDDERRNDIVDTWETLIGPIVAAAMRTEHCLFMGGLSLGRNLIRQEAVAENHAKWVADEKGEVHFVWHKLESNEVTE